MTLPTQPVTCQLYDQTGSPCAGGRVTFRLSVREQYQGIVVPESTEATLDSNGSAVVNLFPNALGSNGSTYFVKAYNDGTEGDGKKVMDTTCVVPNSPCSLHLILSETPYPSLDASAQALAGAQAAAAIATSNAATATTQAANATTHAANASNSALSASNSAATATAQANTATAQAGIATTQATNAANSAAIAFGHASTATTQSSVATTKAADANASATSAATSAGTATTKASEAAASAVTAAANASSYVGVQESLISISANLIRTQTVMVDHIAFT